MGEVSPGLPAERVGLKKGDLVLSIDGKEVSKWEDLHKIIRDSKGKELSIKVKRDGEILNFKVTPQAIKDKNIFGEEVKPSGSALLNPKEVLVEKVNPMLPWEWDLFKPGRESN